MKFKLIILIHKNKFGWINNQEHMMLLNLQNHKMIINY